jgi:hypothetical protein
MNETQPRKLTAAQAVLAVLRHYRAFWENDELLTGSVARLGQLLDTVRNLSPPEPASGDQADRQHAALESIRRIGWFLSTQLVAYASATHQRQLKAQVKYQKTEIVRGPRLATAARAQGLLASAREHLSKLARYQVEPAMLDRLEAALHSLAGLPADRSRPAGEPAPGSADMASLVANLDELLTSRLDKQMDRFESVSPMFFHEYQSARSLEASAGAAASTPPSGRRSPRVRPPK